MRREKVVVERELREGSGREEKGVKGVYFDTRVFAVYKIVQQKCKKRT